MLFVAMLLQGSINFSTKEIDITKFLTSSQSQENRNEILFSYSIQNNFQNKMKNLF